MRLLPAIVMITRDSAAVRSPYRRRAPDIFDINELMEMASIQGIKEVISMAMFDQNDSSNLLAANSNNTAYHGHRDEYQAREEHPECRRT